MCLHIECLRDASSGYPDAPIHPASSETGNGRTSGRTSRRWSARLLAPSSGASRRHPGAMETAMA